MWVYVPLTYVLEAGSEASCSRRSGSLALSATSSATDIANASSCSGCETVGCPAPRFGMTSRPSTGDPGEASSSCSEVSPANRGVSPASASEKPTSVIYGTTSSGSFARWDPELSSWRTYQACLLPEEGEWAAYSERWPRAGMTRNGTAYRLKPLAPLTRGIAFGLWPTPNAHTERPCEGNVRLLRAKVLSGEMTEDEARGMLHGRKSPLEAQGKIPKWPTPAARDWRSGKASEETHAKNSRPLNEVVERRTWPTPKTPTGGGQTQRKTPGGGIRKLEDAVSAEIGRNTGALNPTWVEWLQGFPIGWTVSGSLETDGFPKWRRSLGDG